MANIVKIMRCSGRFSQKELADRLGIHHSTLSGYETGKSRPSCEIIEQIARYCEFEILFRGKQNGEILELKKAE